jgi:hypothetical protein
MRTTFIPSFFPKLTLVTRSEVADFKRDVVDPDQTCLHQGTIKWRSPNSCQR